MWIVDLFRGQPDADVTEDAETASPDLLPTYASIVDGIGCLSRNLAGLGADLAAHELTADQAETVIGRLRAAHEQVEAACRAIGATRESLATTGPHVHTPGHEHEDDHEAAAGRP